MAAGRYEGGDKTLQVLVVGNDPLLEVELRTALSSLPDSRFVIHYADTYRQAVEVASGRQPGFILIDVDRDVAEVASLSKELHDVAPEAAIAGAFKLDRLEQGQSESATIIELLRAEVRDFIRRPLSATELRAVLERLATARTAAVPSIEQGRVVALLSNKGGVGKSTLAVNVACGLAARHPEEVLLVDTSLQGGTCAFTLDLKPSTSLVDAMRQRDRLDPTLLRHLTLKHWSGLRLLAAPADALEGAEVDDEAVSRILHMARRTFRYVVVDTMPTIDSVVMTILDLTDLALVVVQGLAPAVASAARLLPVLEGLGFPPARQRLVLNHNYQPFLGDLKPIDIADRLQRTLDYVVPYEKGILASMNTGHPYILRARRWQRFRRAIDALVADLDGAPVALPAAERPAPPLAEDSRVRLAAERGKGLSL